MGMYVGLAMLKIGVKSYVILQSRLQWHIVSAASCQSLHSSGVRCL